MVAPLREPLVIHKPIKLKAMPEISSKSLEESMLYFQKALFAILLQATMEFQWNTVHQRVCKS